MRLGAQARRGAVPALHRGAYPSGRRTVRGRTPRPPRDVRPRHACRSPGVSTSRSVRRWGSSAVHVASSITATRIACSQARSERSPRCSRSWAAVARRSRRGPRRAGAGTRSPSCSATASTDASAATRSISSTTGGRQLGHVAADEQRQVAIDERRARRPRRRAAPRPGCASRAKRTGAPGGIAGAGRVGRQHHDHVARDLGEAQHGVVQQRHAAVGRRQLVGGRRTASSGRRRARCRSRSPSSGRQPRPAPPPDRSRRRVGSSCLRDCT